MTQNVLQIPTAAPLSGMALVTDVNNALAGLASLCSGGTAPSASSLGLASLAGLLWHDTQANQLKLRNQADSAWIVLGSVNETSGVFVPAAAQVYSPISAATTLALGNAGQFLLCSAGLPLTLPASSGLITAWSVSIFAKGGPVSLSLSNSSDALNGSLGGSIIIPKGYFAELVTDAAGNYTAVVIPASLGISVLASAATVDLGSAASQVVSISGTTAITSFGSSAPAGTVYTLQFAASLTLTYNSASLILPGAASITTAANDCAQVLSLGSGNWICIDYQRANGQPVVSSTAIVGVRQTVLSGPVDANGLPAFGGSSGTQSTISSSSAAWDSIYAPFTFSGASLVAAAGGYSIWGNSADLSFDFTYQATVTTGLTGFQMGVSSGAPSLVSGAGGAPYTQIINQIIADFGLCGVLIPGLGAVNIAVYRNTTQRTTIARTVTNGDVFAIVRAGSVLTLTHNGTTIYTWAASDWSYTGQAWRGAALTGTGTGTGTATNVQWSVGAFTTVTATGTLTVTAAGGFGSSGAVDRVGQITNPSWSGLSTNGTMGLFLDIAANGVCTPAVSSLLQIIQPGGTPSTTNGQLTFNTQQMTGYLGNGSTAPQAYRVAVGEVTVSGGVVAAIVWYGLMGQYTAPWTNTLPGASTAIVASDNLGTQLKDVKFELQCLTAQLGYSVGDIVEGVMGATSAYTTPLTFVKRRNSSSFVTGCISPLYIESQVDGSGTGSNLTASYWSYRLRAKRSF